MVFILRIILAISTAILLAACSGSDEPNTQAPAPAGFTPPTTTSRLDWGSTSERRFQALDVNHDGAVTQLEWPRANSERFASLDSDKNGKISAIEWGEASIRRFDAMDVNKDGSVTSDERRQVEEARGR